MDPNTEICVTCGGTEAMMAAVAGLTMPASYYEGLRALYTEKRDHFLAGLDAIGLKHNVPQGTYFVIGVAAVPGSSFFKEPVNHLIRMHFARGTDVLDEAVHRLAKLTELLKYSSLRF